MAVDEKIVAGNPTVGAHECDMPSQEPVGMHRTADIGYSEVIVGFAPHRGAWTCQSRAGRWRALHSFLGGICCFCDCLEAETS